MAAKAGKSGGSKPDIASFLGLIVALGGIVGGLLIEGGKLSDISQFTAAMIVCGGTLGAVMVTTPLSVLIGGIKQLGGVFLEKSHNPTHIIEEIIGYATRARKNGIVSLESELEKIDDPFLKKALSLAVDGTDLQELRKIMELEITAEEERSEAEAKVYEAAGGYAPTVGIIGAVMGLIQVMKDLADIEKVGHGIATAFVATVYGVALSNLFCLPAATKLKTRAHHAMKTKELMLEGIVSIVEGMNPKLIRMKLAAYEEKGASKKAAKAAAGAPAGKPASVAG